MYTVYLFLSLSSRTQGSMSDAEKVSPLGPSLKHRREGKERGFPLSSVLNVSFLGAAGAWSRKKGGPRDCRGRERVGLAGTVWPAARDEAGKQLHRQP